MATTDQSSERPGAHPLAPERSIEPPAEKRQHYGITFAVLAFGTLSFVLLQSLVLPALPSLQRDLHTSESAVAWVLTAYLLSASIATPILGRLGDMYGKEKMLLVVFGGIVVGSVMGGFATSLPVLIVARIVQGLGGAVFPIAFGIIRDEFPSERVVGGIGQLSTIIGVGGGLGIVLGGPILQHLSYHWLFWIPSVLAMISLVAAWRFIPESPVRAPGRVNLLAALLLSGWLTCLLVAVSMSTHWGWSSARVIGLLVAAVLLVALWVRTEVGSDHPLVDMKMMRIPTVWWTNIAALLFGVGMYSSIVVIPPFLQTATSHGYGFGLSPTVSGLFLAPNAGMMLVTGFAIGALTAWVGAKRLLVVGGAMGAVSFALLMVANGAEWEFLVATTVSGLGVGLAFASMSNLVVDAVPDTQTGVATGMNANIRTIGGAIGSAVVAGILGAGPGRGGFPPLHNYNYSFGILALAFVLASAAAAIVPVRHWRAASAPVMTAGASPAAAEVPGDVMAGEAVPRPLAG